jgi:hypothetical protein
MEYGAYKLAKKIKEKNKKKLNESYRPDGNLYRTHSQGSELSGSHSRSNRKKLEKITKNYLKDIEKNGDSRIKYLNDAQLKDFNTKKQNIKKAGEKITEKSKKIGFKKGLKIGAGISAGVLAAAGTAYVGKKLYDKKKNKK